MIRIIIITSMAYLHARFAFCIPAVFGVIPVESINLLSALINSSKTAKVAASQKE